MITNNTKKKTMQRKNSMHIAGLLIILFLSTSMTSTDLYAQDPTWYSFEEALSKADTTGRPVIVDVWVPWCGWCRKMKQDVYPELAPELTDRFIFARLNRDDHEKVHRYQEEKLTSFRLAQKLKVESVPTIVFLTSAGDYLLHLSGYIEAKELQPVLEYISTGAYRHQTFQNFVKQMDS